LSIALSVMSGQCQAKRAEITASVHNTGSRKSSAIYKEYLTGTGN